MPAPTAVTEPATSLPGIIPTGNPYAADSVPRRIIASTPPTPIAATSTSTWPAAGAGEGASISAMPLGSPNRLIATARTAASTFAR
jgi:hypothetical protein